MAREELPDEVRRFILKSVVSVPYLEALLLMRDNSNVVWTVDEVARRLYIAPTAAAGLITLLRDSGFADETPGTQPAYRYAPQTEAQRDIVDRVAQAYARHLIEVTNLIHSRSGSHAQQFADAFLFRKDSSS